MDRVALIKCEDYDLEMVTKALQDGFRLIGGIDKFINPGIKVLVKPNLLMRKKPETAITTHPVVVEALVGLIHEAGGRVIIADSPGGLYKEKGLHGVYKVTGMEDVAERTKAILNYDLESSRVSHPEGKIIKSLTVINPILEADIVINVPKLKTHGMTLLTGAVKNLFGVIPGLLKAEYHFKMQQINDFANMILDICTYVKPALSVMDAVVGMEGKGPSGGDPRHIGALLVSASPYALDVAAASLIAVNPEMIPTIHWASKRRLCGPQLENIEVVGDRVGDLMVKDFALPYVRDLNLLKGRVPDFLAERINSNLRPKPVFLHDKCIGCSDCADGCPPQAITMVNNRPVCDLQACIRCFCCQELCPERAVDLKRPWLAEQILKR